MGSDDNNDQATKGLNRRIAWTGLAVFSAIALGAWATALKDLKDTDEAYVTSKKEKWVLSATIISLCLAFFAMVCENVEKAKDMFVDKMAEGGLALVLVGIWAGALPVIMDPDNSIAVDANAGILDANLYFSSWAAAITAVYILANYAQTVMHLRAVDFSNTSSQMIKWYIFTFMSVVVMASSARLFKATDCSDSSSFCKRSKYAISLGAIGTAFGLAMCFMSFFGKLHPYFEAAMAFASVALYAVGIAIITFGGDKAPGNTIGNLYFSTWIGFVLSLFLAAACWAEMRTKGEDSEAESAKAEEEDVKEVPEEDVKEVPEEAPAATPEQAATPEVEVGGEGTA